MCTGFLGEARAIARLSGLGGAVLAEYPGHVSMDSPEIFREKVSGVVADQVIAALLGEVGDD